MKISPQINTRNYGRADGKKVLQIQRLADLGTGLRGEELMLILETGEGLSLRQSLEAEI